MSNSNLEMSYLVNKQHVVSAAIKAIAPIKQPMTSNQISRLFISYKVPLGTHR